MHIHLRQGQISRKAPTTYLTCTTPMCGTSSRGSTMIDTFAWEGLVRRTSMLPPRFRGRSQHLSWALTNILPLKRKKRPYFAEKEYTNQMMSLAHAKQQKNLARRTIKTLEEHHQESREQRTKHDTSWNTQEEQEIMVKILRLLTKETWKRTLVNMLEREVNSVIPEFWAKCKNTIGNKFTKSNFLRAPRSDDTWPLQILTLTAH